MITRNSQNGATLITALIMLVVLTLLVVSGIRSSSVNLRIAGNMQAQEEFTNYAQQVIEQVISGNFTANPVSSVVAVTINNVAYSATVVTPVCTASLSLQSTDLDFSRVLDKPCIPTGTVKDGIFYLAASGVVVPPGPSWCSTQKWEVQARATSTQTGADTTVVQGVAIRVPAGTACL